MSQHEIIISKSQLSVNFDFFYSSNIMVPNHWHTNVEVLYLLSGSMHVVCGEQQFMLSEKDLFVINSSEIHYTKTGLQTSYLLLQIPYEFFARCIARFDEVHFHHYFPASKINCSPSLNAMVKHLTAMQDLFQKKEDGYPFLFHSHLQLFLHTLYTQFSQRSSLPEVASNEKALARIRSIIVYVENHYTEDLSLKETASLFALNPEYFCRFFKKHMGFNFLKYVNMVRLSHIHQDLFLTQDSISDILERHGFTNYKLFYKMFKDSYGCTPLSLRNSGQAHNES